MSTLTQATTGPSPSELARNPFEVARSHAIRRLLEVVLPKAPGAFASPAFFRAVIETMREVCEINDDFVRAIGDQVETASPYEVDSRDFDRVSSDGIGDAAYACERIAERMIEDRVS
jgi:hypothetical protein